MAHYALTITTCVNGLRDSDSVWMRKTVLLPFPAYLGLTIELWRDDPEDSTHEVELVSVTYSMKDACFVESQVDDTIREGIESGEVGDEALAEWIARYESFGFTKLTGL